ncbi:MAG: hypothetical protein QXG86_02455 [Candidatus Woesearchaeota archaeon]
MANYLQLSAYVLGFSFVIYIVYIVIKSNSTAREKNIIERMDRLCQLFSETKSLEISLKKLCEEHSIVDSYFNKIVEKLEKGEKTEVALFEVAAESNDLFFRKLCFMMISANNPNGAVMLYNSVKNIKDRIEEKEKEDSKIMVNAFLFEIVLAFIVPLMFYFMIVVVQSTLTLPLIIFLSYVAFSSALIEGVVFKKWVTSIIKIPLVMSIFYIALFYIGPKIMGGFNLV